MVERLRRLMGRAEIRILVLLVCGILLAGLAVSIAQLTKTSSDLAVPTVSSWDELLKDYLLFREFNYPLVVPDECLPYGELEATLEKYTLGELEKQPGWYWNFSGGTFCFEADSELANQLGESADLVVYEDMENGEILILRVPENESEDYREEIVYRAPEWPEGAKSEATEIYLWRELSKRRIAWQVTLKTRKLAEEEQAAEESGPQLLKTSGEDLLLRFGEDYTNHLWLSVEGPNHGLTNVVVGVHVPDGFTNRLEVFAITNLLSFPWSMVETNLSAEGTNVAYWADPAQDELETCFYAVGNADRDSDGDGLPDAQEKFLYGTDPQKWDTDEDGASDGDEIAAGTDPLNNPGDSDGDGLSDDLEIVLGTDPYSDDTDGDWASDGYEVQQDTDPLDPMSTPEIRLLLNGNSVYAMSTNLTVEIPGLVSDHVIFSENSDFQPSVTNAFVPPLSYSLLHASNEWRSLYALPIRNSSETGNVIFGTILLDTEAPSLAITAPTNDWVTSRRWVRVEGLVGPSTSPLQVHINGLFADGVITGTFYRSKLNLALGTNTIKVVASDAAGNATTQQVDIVQDFTGDTNAPQVHLGLPRDYEIVGGVTNWFDQTTFGDEEMLYIAGSVDDETAEVVFLVATEAATNALVAGDVTGTQVWGRVNLHPGANVLTVLASDAAGNVSTSAYTVIRETNFFFSITNPVAYQVVGSRTTLVSGVASPWLATAAITVNGVEAQVADHGTHVSFITVEPILLDPRRTAISAVAEVNGRSYHADPTVYGYEILEWTMKYAVLGTFAFSSSGLTLMDAGGSGFWGAESGVLTGCMHLSYSGPYGWDTGSTSTWAIQTAPFRWGQGPFFSYNMGVEVFGAYMNEDYVWADRPWNGFGNDSLFYFDLPPGSGMVNVNATWDTEIRYVRHWPNPNERTVIFQFIDLDYGRKSYEGINPSAVTFLGATGMWYNGNVAFIVSLEPGAEYVMSKQDFTWPTYVDTRTDPDWGGLSFNFMGHWLTFADFTNDLLKVELKWDGILGDAVASEGVNTVCAGQQIKLRAEVQPSGLGLSVTNHHWTVPGTVIKDFAISPPLATSPNSGTVVPLSGSDASGPSVAFYWVDGNSSSGAGTIREVLYECTVAGVPCSAIARFDVKKPTADIAIENGVTTVDDDFMPPDMHLHFGDSSWSETPGIRFTLSNFVEPWGFGGESKVSWVQLVNSDVRVHIYDSSTVNRNVYGLDNWYPYTAGTSCADSPNEELFEDSLSASANVTYTMWLMFEPDPLDAGAATLPTPLEKIDWSWAATTTNLHPDAANWTCSTNWSLTSESHSVGSSTQTDEYPEWSVNVNSF